MSRLLPFVAAMCGIFMVLLWFQKQTISEQKEQISSQDKHIGKLSAANTAQNATIKALREESARVDLLMGEWGHERDAAEKTRATVRQAVKDALRSDPSFSRWAADSLPDVLLPGRGLLGANRNGTRSAGAEIMPAGSLNATGAGTGMGRGHKR